MLPRAVTDPLEHPADSAPAAPVETLVNAPTAQS